MTIQNWQSDATYETNAVVLHNGEAYFKLDDSDQSEPDHIGGGWQLVPNSNATEYTAIEASFSSYEERKAKHQAEVRQKLAAAGLEPADVLAVLGA
jgi:hypothetical protein